MTMVAPAPGGAPDASAPLTLELVDQIVRLPDPVLRNLRVTLGYYDLSCRISRALGYANANWCTFATWSSRYAGTYIRGEIPVLQYVLDLVEKEANPDDALVLAAAAKFAAANPGSPFDQRAILNLSSRLRTHWLSRLESQQYGQPVGFGSMFALVFAAFGQATSYGNTCVFQDIATTFIPFLDLLEKSSSVEDEQLQRFFRKLSAYPVRLGGQLELRKALEHYARAKFEKDPEQRSRLIFVANGFVGCHEQTRLQEQIPVALDAPIDTATGEIVKLWSALLWAQDASGFRQRVARSLAGGILDRLVRVYLIPAATALADVLWGAFATRWMMGLPLPDETLDLGKDVPPLPDDSAFPPGLDDAALERAGMGGFVHFVSFAYRGTLHGTAASDWTSYTQRMNTIANMFRSRQQRPSLFRPPFLPAQMVLLRKRGSFQIPEGPLAGAAPPFTAEGLRELRACQAP